MPKYKFDHKLTVDYEHVKPHIVGSFVIGKINLSNYTKLELCRVLATQIITHVKNSLVDVKVKRCKDPFIALCVTTGSKFEAFENVITHLIQCIHNCLFDVYKTQRYEWVDAYTITLNNSLGEAEFSFNQDNIGEEIPLLLLIKQLHEFTERVLKKCEFDCYDETIKHVTTLCSSRVLYEIKRTYEFVENLLAEKNKFHSVVEKSALFEVSTYLLPSANKSVVPEIKINIDDEINFIDNENNFVNDESNSESVPI